MNDIEARLKTLAAWLKRLLARPKRKRMADDEWQELRHRFWSDVYDKAKL